MVKSEEIAEIEGWLNPPVVKLLQDLCRRKPYNTDALEVGSWKGKSAICIASCLKPSEVLHCIDTFTGSKEHGDINTLDDFRANIRKFSLEQDLVLHIGDSVKASNNIKDDSLGLIFIDGSHEYQDVLQDYLSLWPKLKAGGYIAFHDAKWPGVKKFLWQHFFIAKNIGPIRRTEDTIYAQKTNHSYFYKYNQLLLKKELIKQRIKQLKRKVKKRAIQFSR